MYGAKEDGLYQAQPAWRWTDHEYTLEIMVPFGMVKSVVADPLQRSCDIKPVNNTWQAK
jgi:hypothetical protein